MEGDVTRHFLGFSGPQFRRSQKRDIKQTLVRPKEATFHSSSMLARNAENRESTWQTIFTAWRADPQHARAYTHIHTGTLLTAFLITPAASLNSSSRAPTACRRLRETGRVPRRSTYNTTYERGTCVREIASRIPKPAGADSRAACSFFPSFFFQFLLSSGERERVVAVATTSDTVARALETRRKKEEREGKVDGERVSRERRVPTAGRHGEFI